MRYLKIILIAILVLISLSAVANAFIIKQIHWNAGNLITGKQVSEQTQITRTTITDQQYSTPVTQQGVDAQEFAAANEAFNAARQEAEKSISDIKELLNKINAMVASSPELSTAIRPELESVLMRAKELGQLLEQTKWVFQWSVQNANDDVTRRIYVVTESILIRSQDLINNGGVLVNKLEQQKTILEKTIEAKKTEKAKLIAERERLKASVKQKQIASTAEREEKKAKWTNTIDTLVGWLRRLFG